jgi:hypothetical protein
MIQKLAAIIDQLYKITYNSDGKIVLWKLELFQGKQLYSHCHDIKLEFISFSKKHKCDYYSFRGALQFLADQQNAFEND